MGIHLKPKHQSLWHKINVISLFTLNLLLFSHTYAYTQCIDLDGNGTGTFESTGELCRIPARFDRQSNVSLAHVLNNYGDLVFNFSQPQCQNLEDYTFPSGCYHPATTLNLEFNNFAMENNFYNYSTRQPISGLLSKLYPAGNNDSPWDKLVIVVGPFNSTGFMTIDHEVDWLLNQSRGTHLTELLNYFHIEGISVLYVSSNHPSTHLLPVKDKSLALTDIIEKIKTIRRAESTSAREPIKILGLSLGGVISRLALVSMENSSRSHDVDLFFSMDSPHKGAHIPASIQHLATFLENSFQVAADKTEVPGLFNFALPFAGLVDQIFKGLLSKGTNRLRRSSHSAALARYKALGSIPTKELLAFHIDHAQTSYFSPEYLKFINLGFTLPGRTKANIAITNSSLNGQIDNSAREYLSIITTEKKSTRLSFSAKTDTPNTTIFEGKLSFPNRNSLFLTDREYYERLLSGPNHVSHDSVPCSTTDDVVDTLTDELDTLIQTFWPSSVKVTNNTTCFIPLGSSIFSSVNFPTTNPLMNDLTRSPFDVIIGTSRNTPHLSFEREIVSDIIQQFKNYRATNNPNNNPLPEGFLIEGTTYRIRGRHLTYAEKNSCIHENSEAPVEANNNLDLLGETSSPLRYQALLTELQLAYKNNREGNCRVMTGEPPAGSSLVTDQQGLRPLPSEQQLEAAERGAVITGETYYIGGVNLKIGTSGNQFGLFQEQDSLEASCLLPNNDNPVPAINDLDLQGASDRRYNHVKTILSQTYQRNDNRICSAYSSYR